MMDKTEGKTGTGVKLY